MWHIEELAEKAYEAYASSLASEGHDVPIWSIEAYASSLASEGHDVPIWSMLTWQQQQAWRTAVQIIVNANLWGGGVNA